MVTLHIQSTGYQYIGIDLADQVGVNLKTSIDESVLKW